MDKTDDKIVDKNEGMSSGEVAFLCVVTLIIAGVIGYIFGWVHKDNGMACIEFVFFVIIVIVLIAKLFK